MPALAKRPVTFTLPSFASYPPPPPRASFLGGSPASSYECPSAVFRPTHPGSAPRTAVPVSVAFPPVVSGGLDADDPPVGAVGPGEVGPAEAGGLADDEVGRTTDDVADAVAPLSLVPPPQPAARAATATATVALASGASRLRV